MTSPYRPVVRFAGLRGERHVQTRNWEVDSVLPADPEAPSHAYAELTAISGPQRRARVGVDALAVKRGIEADHVTVYRWVQRFTPLLADAARPCRHLVGDRWQVDDTYVKVAGRWRYSYRAVDQFGQIIDVVVPARRHAGAARRLFQQAIKITKVQPTEIVTDKATMYPAVLEELLPAAWHCTDRYATTELKLITAG
jgi:transposase InsO family protein